MRFGDIWYGLFNLFGGHVTPTTFDCSAKWDKKGVDTNYRGNDTANCFCLMILIGISKALK